MVSLSCKAYDSTDGFTDMHCTSGLTGFTLDALD